MPAALFDRIRAASEELAGALRQTSDPAFEARALDPALVGRLQAAVATVEYATKKASAEERDEVRAHPAYAEYRELLAQLHAALSTWQARLFTYRAQLDRKSERVSAASHWAEAYNRTR
jgi:hypothetical protein